MLEWRTVDPTLLYRPFRDAVEAFLKESPYSWFATYGFRSEEEQRALYEPYRLYRAGLGPKAPRAAPPGRSAHNYGLAIDVCLDVDAEKPGLQPSWDTNLPGWLWLKSRSIPHPTLRNGWRFHDWPHIEWVAWKAVAAAMREAATRSIA